MSRECYEGDQWTSGQLTPLPHKKRVVGDKRTIWAIGPKNPNQKDQLFLLLIFPESNQPQMELQPQKGECILLTTERGNNRKMCPRAKSVWSSNGGVAER